MVKTQVCVVGGGSREHALALSASRTHDVVVTPGNPGIVGPNLSSSSLPVDDIQADLFIIGPEQPLVDGIADRLRSQGKVVLGPGVDGARLEGSKAWMKEVLAEAGVPTARHGIFDDFDQASKFLRTMNAPYVIKTDGLAAGKGVLVTESIDDALYDLKQKLSGTSFGNAGRQVVIEEGLSGPELSLFVLCDGRSAVPFEFAQDFKRVGDHDAGPNTGGMGAYSPVPGLDSDLLQQVMDEAVFPTIKVLQSKGIDYRGVLYAGLMLTPDGPKILEYNIRFGDPETQVVIPRLKNSLVELSLQAANGRLEGAPEFSDDAAVNVVLAVDGYPSEPAPVLGDAIEGLDAAVRLEGVTVFHAGTKMEDGQLQTAGGRVLNVTAIAPTLAQARDRAYEAVKCISWRGMQYRTDIAEKAAAL